MSLQLALDAARAAGRVLLDHYRQPHDVMVKGHRDITTEADLAAEAISIATIKAGCPDARFVSEESHTASQRDDDAPVWYIDPLDGTSNYAHGLPCWCVSVGMVQRGQVQVGVVFDPATGDLFTAERGKGAFCNGEPIHASSRATLAESIVLCDWPRDQAQRNQGVRYYNRWAPEVFVPRSLGSAALGLCYVAAGWADAYFQYTLKPWDVAAGLLLLQEAGAMATCLRGEPAKLNQGDWLASNGLIHEALLNLQPYG